MPDLLSDDERDAIAAFDESRIQRIPRGVSGEPSYTWVSDGTGQMNERLKADRPTGWRAGAAASYKRVVGQNAKFERARQACNERAKAKRQERLPAVLEMLNRPLSQADVARKLGLSASSIRDDVGLLKARGLL